MLDPQKIFVDYLDSVLGYVEKRYADKKEVLDTGLYPMGRTFVGCDEDLMRAIEENADVSEPQADEFRRAVVAYIGATSLNGQALNWTSQPQLKQAILGYLAEHDPGILETLEPAPKYRRVTDPWEPAW